MKEIQTKKTITENAIKNAKRKHQAEITDLTAKLEFLRDEEALMKEKMEQVKGELSTM